MKKKVFKLWKWQILNINWLEKDIVCSVSKSSQQEYFFKIIQNKNNTVILEEISEEDFNKKLSEKNKKWVIKRVLEKTWLLKKN